MSLIRPADFVTHTPTHPGGSMRIVSDDQIWDRIRSEALADAAAEPALAGFLNTVVLGHNSLESALSYLLAAKLESPVLNALTLRDLIEPVFCCDGPVKDAIRADLQAVMQRDPACRGYSTPLLYFKGFHSIQAYRVAHHYWMARREPLALFLQSRISEVFAVDIHPGARLGKGLLFDHATSVVIGETAVIEDDFSMLHEVTLGGTGKIGGDRHPKIGRGVMIGAGAKVLGNIKVGEGAKIGAGSVVLRDVPPHTTVAGVPAKPVSMPAVSFPALEMDQTFDGTPIRKKKKHHDEPEVGAGDDHMIA
ncbi:MAG TPA: serine O-acetyltransferase [Propioniciclava tarda]|nr:serine O-acetyltransferase [Propioniciclava tarda]HQA30105.1 serine O-acetyltransferase [Propioniciclava tarda]HQD59997.1 serine O-acetyltransferase [Propioniciclava tarda]